MPTGVGGSTHHVGTDVVDHATDNGEHAACLGSLASIIASATG
jgi:hypothetical protein